LNRRDRIRSLLGTLAILALLLETCLLRGTLEWFDVYVSTLSTGLQTGPIATLLMRFTNAAPYIGAALVVAGIVFALGADTDPREIASILVQLAAGLLLAWVFKMLFERARPGELPWDLTGDSFPSGHVANAVICVGTSCRLLRRGAYGRAGGVARLILVVCGLAFVPAVAFSRIVLARHWMTDVLGSLLLGSALVALAPRPRPATTRRLLVAMPLVLLVAWATSATGSRIRLPSPSSMSGIGTGRWQPNEDYLGAMEIAFAWDPSEPPSNRFTLLAPKYGKQRVDVLDGRSTILKLLARPQFDVSRLASRGLELLVDGAVVGTQPLGSGWRMLAFALPTLTPGPHELELRPRRLDR